MAKAYEYDEFGETTVKAGESFWNEIGYTGQIYDESTGLYYYNARFYDPEDGRFVSQDTYRGEQMEPGTWHLYSYCANDPVNFVDPSGHKKKRPAIPDRDYTKKKTFKYKRLGLTVLTFSMTIKWRVRSKKIKWVKQTYKKKMRYSYKFKKCSTERRYNEIKQACQAIYFVQIEAPTSSPYLPIYIFYYPGAWVYNDGGCDWYKKHRL